MLVTICALGALALTAGVVIGGSDVWALDLPTFFWPAVAAPSVLVLVVALVAGGPLARIAAAAAVGFCAVPYILLPPAPADMPGERLRILTANLYVGNPDPRPFVSLLTSSQPDIVVMQETRPTFAAAVRGSGLYPFESGLDLSETDDKIVFSRYPVRDARQLDDGAGGTVERHAMRLVVETPAGPVTVYAIHPDTPRTEAQWRERNAYFDRLAAAIGAEKTGSPVVVAGDWNLPAYSPFFRRFFTATGYRFARPGYWLPVTRFATRLARYGFFGSTIDHVAVSPDIRVTNWRRGHDIGSNHLPVIVDLALPSLEAVASRTEPRP